MKRFLKLILTFSIFMFSGLLLSGCDDDIILVVGVDFYQEQVLVSVGEQLDLSHKVYPSNATNAKVTYWSSDPNIATVDELGHVTVKDSGEVLIAIRTVDGGYEDFCKIVTNIDPDEIKWNTSDGRIVPADNEEYSGETTVAIGQVIKLEVDYLLNGAVSEEVTNKDITFTSSNPENVEVINAKEGILRAIDSNVRNADNIPYSYITATLKTAKGEKKLVCRVSVNEYTTVDILFVNSVEGDEEILINRDGSEKLYLDAEDNIGIEYYAYLLNASNFKKTDYDMTLRSSDEEVFTIKNAYSSNNVMYFRLLPIKEGSANLFVDTTCYNENGIQVSAVINVIVPAAVDKVKVSASDKKETTLGDALNHEIVVSGDIFSIDFEYFDEDDKKIENAEREVQFFDIDSYCIYDPVTGEYLYNVKYKNGEFRQGSTSINMTGRPNDISDDKIIVARPCSDYITLCGDNKYKVSSVPDDINQVFCIQGYVAKENHSDINKEENRTYFCYYFYIRNELQGIIATKQEATKDGNDQIDKIPMTGGIDEVTILSRSSEDIFVYTFAFFSEDTIPANITYIISDESLISVSCDGNKYTIASVVPAGAGSDVYPQGEGMVTFTATDGEKTVSIDILVHIVR